MSKKKQRKPLSEAAKQERRIAQKRARFRRKWRNAALALCGAGLIAASAFGISRAGTVRNGDIHGAVVAETAHYQVTPAMLAYYFREHIDSYLSYASANSGMPVFDESLPLNDQYYDEEQEKSWYDFFMDNTINTVKQTLGLCEAAYAAGYTLPEDVEAEIAADAAATDLSHYQAGVREEDVAAVMKLQMIGRGYQQEAYAATEDISDEALAAELAANPDDYARFGVACFVFDWEADDQAEKADAVNHAEEMADCGSRDAFLAYAQEYMENETTLSDEIIAQRLRAMELTLSYSTCGDDIAAWAKQAKVGETFQYSPDDANYIEVLMMTSLPAPDEGACVDLRVIYMPATLHSNDMEETLEAADKVISDCQAAGSTPEAFAQLATQYSADSSTAANGGLIEGYSCNRTEYGAETAEWAFAAGRKQGDMFICEREAAAVVAYYEGKNDLLGWQNQAKAKLLSQQYSVIKDAANCADVIVHEENQRLVTG